jgi:signal transduction histidine kinase
MSEPALRLVEGIRGGTPDGNRLLEAQKEVLEKIVRGAPLRGVLAALCEIVDDQATRPARAAILLVSECGRLLKLGAAPGLPEEYSAALDGIAIHPHVGTCCAAAARREIVVTRDIAADPGWKGLAQLPLGLGLKAAWSMPIYSSSGAVLGTFGTYFKDQREPTTAEIRLVEVLSRTAALAIERDLNDRRMRDSEAHYRGIVEATRHREAAEQALAKNRARLDYAVRLSGVGFWSCVLPFGELTWDQRVREHFFMPADARVHIDDFYLRIHPKDRDATRLAIEASMRDRVSYDVVYRTVNPENGDIKWIHSLGGMTFGADGTATHFDGVTVDVTAQKRDQQRLAEALERVSDQDRRKDEFLATLAHELRNPLAPIRTGLSILRSSATPEQQARTREMMERQLKHLVRMVDDLLDISRISLGKVTLKKERIDFRTALHSAIETTRALIEARRHGFSVHLPPDALPLEVDPTRLAQIIANLLNNAAKYTPEGGRIGLHAAREGETLVVRICDNGIGIPAHMLARVFEMFTQVSGAVEHGPGGLGIGLTLVRGLVEMHGGVVSAESAGPGQGTTVTVRLPLAPRKNADAADSGSEHTTVGARRILVVDDNADAASSLAMLLELEGHATRVANTGSAVLATVREFAPHAVFLDIGLPDISGYEVARRLRDSLSEHALPRLIALTGWGSDEDRRQALAAGFDAHLVKPVEPAELRAVLS